MRQPIYSVIASNLRQMILHGNLKPNSRLPTERELCEQLGASRITIRGALQVLEQEGLIRRVQGSGSYISPNPQRRIPLGIDFTASVSKHAPSLQRKLIEREDTVAGDLAAGLLNILVGAPVLRAVRVDSIRGAVVAWDELFIPADLAGSLNKSRLSAVDFIEVWTNAEGIRTARCEQQVTARLAGARDLELLRLKAGAAILETTERYFDSSRNVMGVFITHYNPQMVTIRSEAPLESGPAED